ncbi:MAG TPA: CrcB family protein [Candidatus Limosilactobacillus intestinigallinarum]|nr:CrcB family protein [Candidatus Limosilactobacillus intestinigallinarum]
MKLTNAISVAAFGFAGGICRALLSTALDANGVLIANLLGCFLLAFLTYYVIERDLLAGWLNAGLGTGLIGAFTTFSSFSTTTIRLAQHSLLRGGGYLLVSMIGGLVMAGLGMLLARYLGRMVGRHA